MLEHVVWREGAVGERDPRMMSEYEVEEQCKTKMKILSEVEPVTRKEDYIQARDDAFITRESRELGMRSGPEGGEKVAEGTNERLPF